MGKTRAEIQKAYRERKRLKEGDDFLRKERERVKKYYKPVKELSKKAAQQRREKIRKSVQLCRRRQKANKALCQLQNTTPGVSDSEGVTTRSSTSLPSQSTTKTTPGRLVVKLNFRRSSTKKRVSRAVSKAHREIQRMKMELQKKTRAYNRVSRKYQRLFNRVGNKAYSQTTKEVQMSSTPRGKAESELRRAGLSPRKVPQLRKKLLFANAVCEEIKEAQTVNKGSKKRLIGRVVSGNIIKKYRCMSRLRTETGVDRKRQIVSKVCQLERKRRLEKARAKLKETVVNFMERDDNSRVFPGKSDVKKTSEGKKQKRVMTDFMKNVHAKFCAENPHIKISFSAFCKLRPVEIQLTNFMSRNRCLCLKHQNVMLKIKAMKNMGIKIVGNPDQFVSQNSPEQMKNILSEIKSNVAKYEHWKRVQVEDGTYKTKIVAEEVTTAKFIEIVLNELEEFRQHVHRVKVQYEQLHKLKENLPEGHAMVQMDFAENYSCISADEVQSAYWNTTMVTLHPVVLYYKDSAAELQHKSMIFVSDELSHNCNTVLAIIKRLIPYLKKELPFECKWLHYWTDSPTSQYRNKHIFNLISIHEERFGMKATWNYFEAGHGKGPCDGLGGTCKRLADLAVRQNKVSIQSAADFHAWGSEQGSNINYMLVSKSECECAAKENSTLNVKPVKGTMKIHAVVGLGSGAILHNKTSCYCDACKQGSYDKSCGWEEAAVSLPNTPVCRPSTSKTTAKSTSETKQQHGEDSEEINPKIGDWVAAVYDCAWYIGQVKEIDPFDKEIYISFLQKCPGRAGNISFKKPSRDDEIWVSLKDVLCCVEQPRSACKRGRVLHVSSVTEELVREFLRWKKIR